MMLASLAPFVLPFALAAAVTRANGTAEEAAGLGRMAGRLHLGLERAYLRRRVVAVDRRIRQIVEVRHRRARRPPVVPVARPAVDDRGLVVQAPQPRHERGLVAAERRAERDRVRLLVVHLADDVVDRLVALRERLLRDDLPAELGE